MEEEGKTIIHNNYSQGANCQVFNSPVTGCVFAMPGAQVTQQLPPASADKEETPEATLDEKQEAIVEELARAAFFGMKDDARAFLIAIKGMLPPQITETVRQWVADGRICGMSKGTTLWKILHENNIYPKGKNNWNEMIRKGSKRAAL